MIEGRGVEANYNGKWYDVTVLEIGGAANWAEAMIKVRWAYAESDSEVKVIDLRLKSEGDEATTARRDLLSST